AVPHSRAVQRRLLGPRDAADLPVRDPGVRGAGELRTAADDRRPRHGVPPPQRPVLLAAAARRPDDADELPGPGRLVCVRLDRVRAVIDDDAAGAAVLHDRRAARGVLVDLHRAQLPRDDHHDARTGDELLPDAAAGLGELLDLAAGRDRHTVHRLLAVLRAAGPGARLPLLRRVRRRRAQRQRADVPARVLVLLAPGGLHHDAAGLRDHLRDPGRQGPQADLRLPDDGVLAAGDRDARVHRLGPQHVRLRDAALDPDPDDDHDRDHRDPDGDQDLLVAGAPVARGAAPRHADAVRARVPDDVHTRRDP